MPERGQTIAGKYRLERLIGQGAFATVWAASHLNLDREVALKILADAPSRKASTVERFMNEARICAAPIHPTIVTVEDIGQDDSGQPYLVMELLDGHTLDRVLRTKGMLPWSMVCELARQVLEGLAAAHGRGIIHRDIKPSNIFLVRDFGDGPPVRILDLGLARDLAEEKRLTRTGQVVGTANYLPPETLLDRAPKGGTKAGDVFAVGMVMFVALTGRFPFLTAPGEASPAAEVYARARFYKSGERLPGPCDYERSIPRPVDEVVRKALAVDPSERYGDAAEMRDALAGAIAAITPRDSRDSLRECLAATHLEPTRPEMEDRGEVSSCASAEAWAALLDFTSAPPPDPFPAPAQDDQRPTPDASSPPEDGRASGRPSRRPSDGRASAPSRPSSLRSGPRTRVAAILLGVVVGAIVSVGILGAIVAWHACTHVPAASVIGRVPSGGATTWSRSPDGAVTRRGVVFTADGVVEPSP